MEKAHGDIHGSRFQDGSRFQLLSGTKAATAALQTILVPHIWHKHSRFLQPSPWETFDAAYDLCFAVCLKQNLFLMVGRDYKQGVLWV